MRSHKFSEPELGFSLKRSAIALSACFAFAMSVASCGGGSDKPLDATSANCFDDSTLTLGTKAVVNYTVSGHANGTRTETSTVSAVDGQFNGTGGLLVRTVGTTGEEVQAIPGVIPFPFNILINDSIVLYEKLQATGVLALYGTFDQGRFSTITEAYAPPYVDARNNLAVGASATFIQLGTRTIATPIVGELTSKPINGRIQVTFQGVEVLNLSRGLTPACRYSVSVNDGPKSTEWLFRSVLVRREQPSTIPALAFAPEILELQSATINGAPL